VLKAQPTINQIKYLPPALAGSFPLRRNYFRVFHIQGLRYATSLTRLYSHRPGPSPLQYRYLWIRHDGSFTCWRHNNQSINQSIKYLHLHPSFHPDKTHANLIVMRKTPPQLLLALFPLFLQDETRHNNQSINQSINQIPPPPPPQLLLALFPLFLQDETTSGLVRSYFRTTSPTEFYRYATLLTRSHSPGQYLERTTSNCADYSTSAVDLSHQVLRIATSTFLHR
jgi:hypothetical protein